MDDHNLETPETMPADAPPEDEGALTPADELAAGEAFADAPTPEEAAGEELLSDEPALEEPAGDDVPPGVPTPEETVGAEAPSDQAVPGDEPAADLELELVEVSASADDTDEEAATATGERSGEPLPEPDPSLLCGLQCILFVAGEPLPVDRLAVALELEVTDVPRLCDRLNAHLAGQGLHVVQLAGGFALATRPEFADYVQRLLEPEPERLSIQALETLAIVAYRQPITRPEIDQLRGVNSGGVVSSLLEKGLLRIRGRKDAPGRPFLIETTPHFLSAFGLSDLSDLPKVDLPEIGHSDEPKVLGEALEELSTIPQEDAPSADQ